MVASGTKASTRADFSNGGSGGHQPEILVVESRIGVKLNPPVVLGIDVGTSSVRAVGFDRVGVPVEGMQSQKTFLPDASPDGGVTVDAETLTRLTLAVLDEVDKQAMDRSLQVEAVGFSCFWHSLLAIDESGHPLTPVILWADTRPESEVGKLRSRLDGNEVHQQTGRLSSFELLAGEDHLAGE